MNTGSKSTLPLPFLLFSFPPKGGALNISTLPSHPFLLILIFMLADPAVSIPLGPCNWRLLQSFCTLCPQSCS